MEMLSGVLGILSYGHVIFTVLLIALVFTLRKSRELLLDVLEISHIVFLASVWLNIFLVIITFYHDSKAGYSVFIDRATGMYWWSYWLMTLLPITVLQVLWWKKARRSIGIALLMIFCSWSGRIIETAIIFVTSLHRDFLPSSWTPRSPSPAELIISLAIYAVLVMAVHFGLKRFPRSA